MPRPKKFPYVLSNRYGKVTVYLTRNGEYTSYKICWAEGRVRRKETRPTEADAVARANEVMHDLEAGASARPDAGAQQWDYYRRCEAMLNGVPLINAVEYFMEHGLKTNPTKDHLVQEVIDGFIASRKLAGAGSRYLSSLKYDLEPLVDVMKKPFGQVTVQDIDAYLATFTNARTRLNKRNSIVTCWRWARSKDWIPRDKATSADLTDTPSVKSKDPGVIEAEELTAVLQKAEADDTARHLIPYLVIGAFAGARSAEICRMTWEEHIKLDQGLIILGSDVTKTKRRRVIHMEAALVNWLTHHQSTGPVVKVVHPHRYVATLRTAPWPHNALRHSAVSYLMAMHRNAALVAEQCGHTETQLQTDYKAAVTPEQALKWFNIQPIWQAIPTQQKAESA